MSEGEFVPDHSRAERIGFGEAIYAAGKSVAQLTAILEHAVAGSLPMLLTRLEERMLCGIAGAAAPPYRR